MPQSLGKALISLQNLVVKTILSPHPGGSFALWLANLGWNQHHPGWDAISGRKERTTRSLYYYFKLDCFSSIANALTCFSTAVRFVLTGDLQNCKVASYFIDPRKAPCYNDACEHELIRKRWGRFIE